MQHGFRSRWERHFALIKGQLIQLLRKCNQFVALQQIKSLIEQFGDATAPFTGIAQRPDRLPLAHS